jgi:hypothetical protein
MNDSDIKGRFAVGSEIIHVYMLAHRTGERKEII